VSCDKEMVLFIFLLLLLSPSLILSSFFSPIATSDPKTRRPELPQTLIDINTSRIQSGFPFPTTNWWIHSILSTPQKNGQNSECPSFLNPHVPDYSLQTPIYQSPYFIGFDDQYGLLVHRPISNLSLDLNGTDVCRSGDARFLNSWGIDLNATEFTPCSLASPEAGIGTFISKAMLRLGLLFAIF